MPRPFRDPRALFELLEGISRESLVATDRGCRSWTTGRSTRIQAQRRGRPKENTGPPRGEPHEKGNQRRNYKNLDKLEALMGRRTFRVPKSVLDLPPETRVIRASCWPDRREARDNLIEAARRREIDVVRLWRLDRWGRPASNPKQTQIFLLLHHKYYATP